MARGILSTMSQIAREGARQQAQQQREAVRAQKAKERASQKAARTAEAQKKLQVAAAKATHVEAKQAEVEVLNASLEENYSAIDGLLVTVLDVDNYFDLHTLCREPEHPPFEHPQLERPAKKPTEIQDPIEPIYKEPSPPRTLFGKKKKHEAAIAAAHTAHALAQAEWHSDLEKTAARRKVQQEEFRRAEEKRLVDLEREKARYAKECTERENEVAKYNASIDSLIANLGYGASDAVETYISTVFSQSLFPDDFPVSHDVKFEPSTAELRLRAMIPPPSELEKIKVYRYVKKDDEIVPTELSQKARKDRYASAVHQVALRSIHEIFDADRRGLIKTVSLEVGAEAKDPATGKMGFIPFTAVAAEREKFLEFDLSAVVPKSTLTLLGAAVSKNPYELLAADTSGVRRS